VAASNSATAAEANSATIAAADPLPVENPTVPYALEDRTAPSESTTHEPFAASAEVSDSSTTDTDDQSAPSAEGIDAELAEKRKRSAELILAGQRRRRRARGY
jgi:hypothetical protein